MPQCIAIQPFLNTLHRAFNYILFVHKLHDDILKGSRVIVICTDFSSFFSLVANSVPPSPPLLLPFPLLPSLPLASFPSPLSLPLLSSLSSFPLSLSFPHVLHSSPPKIQLGAWESAVSSTSGVRDRANAFSVPPSSLHSLSLLSPPPSLFPSPLFPSLPLSVSSLSLPPSFPLLLPPFPLLPSSPPKIQLGAWGSAVSSPSGVRDRANAFYAFCFLEKHLVATILLLEFAHKRLVLGLRETECI